MNSERKEVTIVHPPSRMLERQKMVPPLGPLQLGAELEEGGHSVKVIDVGDDSLDLKEVMETQFLAVSATTPQYLEAKELCRQVLIERSKRGLKYPQIAIGGAHATYMGSMLLEDGWDYVVAMEGDSLINSLVEGKIAPGFLVGETQPDLNQLPLPAYHLVDLMKYRRDDRHLPTAPIMTSKGCPHDCSFCSNELWNRKMRFYDPEYVLKVIRKIKEMGINQVVFYDDDALINHRDRIPAISRGLEPLGVTWRCNTHVNTIDNEKARQGGILKMIREAGCRHISLGIDGADDEALRFFGKATTLVRCKRAIEMVKESGIYVKTFLIYIPGRGIAYVDKIINFIKETNPDFVQASVLIPMPGSDMYKNPERFGLLFDREKLNSYFYVGRKGESGDVGMLNQEDRLAIDYMHDWIREWQKSKPVMPL